MRSAFALRIFSGKIIYKFGIPERLRTLRYSIHIENHKLSLWKKRAVALKR